jgi:hypothetical protein
MAAQGENPKIVLSYRRSDSAMAGRIFDRLAQHFGKTNLFIDIDNVPFGVDFRKHIDEALQASDLLISVVGEKWLGPQEGGKLRIMNAADPVRVELETALRRDITVLPVLLEGASMPDPAELPESMRDFAYRNALEVESGRDFNVHIDRLIRAIEQSLGIKAKMPRGKVSPLLEPVPPAKKGWAKPLALGVAGLIIAAGLGTAVWYWLAHDKEELVGPGGRAVPQAFCDDLKRVVAAAGPNKFTSILGAQHSGIWTARIQLPGWEDCTVRDWAYQGKVRRYYSCVLRSFADIAEMDTMLTALQAYVKPCLGPDWTERRDRFSDGTSDATYEMSENDPFVRLRETYYDNPKEWIMRLDVENPPEPAPAPAQ